MLGVKSVVALLVILLSAVATGAIQLVFSEEEVLSRNKVLVAELDGTIEEGAGAFMFSALSPQRVRGILGEAEQDPSVGAVVLRINSPGGSIAASQQISELIRDFEKPVVVSMADMAASGGYYISAPADGIVAHPGTTTGSIGVISTFMDLEGFLENLGLEMEVVKSGKYKDMFNRTLTEEERELMQELSDEAYQQFIEEVARGREMNAREVRELATGELFLGSKAKRLGLVDRLGGQKTAVEFAAELAEIEDPLVEYYGEMDLFDIFFSSGLEVFRWWEYTSLPEEVILMEEMYRRGGKPEFRYEVQ